MSTFQTTLIGVAATLSLLATSGGVAYGENQPGAAQSASGRQVLDLMCELNGGTAVNTPFAIARCQEARTRRGFEIERIVCELLLDGRFASAPSFGRPNRTTWSCFSSAPSDI